MSRDPYARPGWLRFGVIGPVLALLVVIGLLVANLTEDSSDSPDEISQSTSPTVTPERPADAEIIEGRGYSYALPDEWTDQTEALRTEGGLPTTDTGAVWGDDLDDLLANVIVQLGDTTDETDLESLRSTWEAGLASGDHARTEVPATSIGGYDAIGVRLEESNARGKRVASTAYLVVVDEQTYTIVLSTPPSYEDDALAAFTTILDSWAWA
ncbi:hypothetical protein [Nocardioides sp. Root151]|uniref:hypothetical protein n=1 Tax=Nocardioides sp. Root151 TaxID=1736475 RepID=UPI000702D896|nr:hypothetical protein [Nocardioides sp. Root151]KQZ67471.1 hypothetical protein ASD66_21265 [Nocardioides sp. Root151]